MSKDRDRDDSYSRSREGATRSDTQDRRSQEASRKDEGRSSRDDRERGEKRMSREDHHKERRTEEDSKKRRHNSRSESESNNSQERSSSPDKGKESSGSLGDRLRAIAGSNTGVRCGTWLKTEMAQYKKLHKIDDESEPTEEEIKLHLKLPNPDKISEFKEPLRQWEAVENTGIPSWNKDLLPEEEIEKPADWKPPTPPRVDISLISAIEAFESEAPRPPKIKEIINDKRAILESKMDDTDEIVLYSGACIVRTTKKGIDQSKKDRENEEREEARQFGGGGFRGGRGRGGGGRGGRGGRGGGDRDARGGGFGSRDNRSFDRSRNLSGRSSPGRNSIKSENIEDWKDRRDRRSSQEDSRPPRRDSYERRPEAGSSSSSTKRSFSPESQSRGRDDRRTRDMAGELERKWSGQDRGGGDHGGGYGDRRDGRDIIKERRDSRGYGEIRDENKSGYSHGSDRRDSRGGEVNHGTDRRESRGGYDNHLDERRGDYRASSGSQGNDRRAYDSERRDEPRGHGTHGGDRRDDSRGHYGHDNDRRDSRGGYDDRERRPESRDKPRESMRAPHGQSAAAAAAGQPPLTYKEYKARKAAEAAARGN